MRAGWRTLTIRHYWWAYRIACLQTTMLLGAYQLYYSSLPFFFLFFFCFTVWFDNCYHTRHYFITHMYFVEKESRLRKYIQHKQETKRANDERKTRAKKEDYNNCTDKRQPPPKRLDKKVTNIIRSYSSNLARPPQHTVPTVQLPIHPLSAPPLPCSLSPLNSISCLLLTSLSPTRELPTSRSSAR